MCKKKKDEVNEMEITYKVEAKCNQVSGINVEFKGIGNIETAFECAVNLGEAFPMVDVINEQTGEVVYSRYIATDFFHRTTEMGTAIFKAECDMCF
jgi:hypothetical protein